MTMTAPQIVARHANKASCRRPQLLHHHPFSQGTPRALAPSTPSMSMSDLPDPFLDSVDLQVPGTITIRKRKAERQEDMDKDDNNNNNNNSSSYQEEPVPSSTADVVQPASKKPRTGSRNMTLGNGTDEGILGGKMQQAENIEQPLQQGEESSDHQGGLSTTSGGRSIWGSLSNYEDGHISKNEWLKDDIIDAVVHTIVSMSTRYIGLGPFELRAAADCGPPAAMQFFEKELAGALFVANQGSTHWVAGRVDLASRLCEIYDSLQTNKRAAPPSNLQKDLKRNFSRLVLPDRPTPNWAFELQTCPQQPNAHDCGVFALATIWHLVHHDICSVPTCLIPTSYPEGL